MPFLGDIVVTPLLDDPSRWKLVQGFSYQGRHELFEVPPNITTDFASVPRVFVWLLPRYGRWTPAAILHDHLWSLARKGEFKKIDADGIFNRAMRELGVPFLRRWIMWAAVRWAAGPGTWFEKGPKPFGKMIAISVPASIIVVPPAAAVAVGLAVGAGAEFVAYLPLRLLRRDRTKAVNPPEVRDMLLT